MLVSIVIPCYNQGPFLTECLQSVTAQTYQDWEALVVDDGSTEEGLAVVAAKFQDDRIRYIRHPLNRGLAAARNTGIRAARGEVILPLDADDKLAPTYLERLLPCLWNNPHHDCAFPDLLAFGHRSGRLTYRICDLPTLLTYQWLPGAGTLLRKSLWERAGGYCEAEPLRIGNEDWDFYLSAATVGFQPFHVPEALYLYRTHEHSMVTRLRYFDYQTREFMYQRHRALFDRYRRGSAFLAGGYLESAEAARLRGERGRALRLGARACWLAAPRSPALISMSKSLIPLEMVPLAKRRLRTVRNLQHRVLTHLRAPSYRAYTFRQRYWNAHAREIDLHFGQLDQDFACLGSLITRHAVKRILDVGCGSGRLFPLYHALNILEVVGQDIADEALRLAQERQPAPPVQLLNTPILDLPFTHHFFDLVVCNRVLQFVPVVEIEAVIVQLCRLGRLVYLNELSEQETTEPTFFMFKHDYGHLFHRQGYTPYETGSLQSEAGTQQPWTLFGPRATRK